MDFGALLSNKFIEKLLSQGLFSQIKVLKTFYAEIDGNLLGANFNGGVVHVYRVGRRVTLHFSSTTHVSHSSPSTDDQWLPTWAYAVDSIQNSYMIDSNHIADYSMGPNGAGQFEYRTFSGATYNKGAPGNLSLSYLSADLDEFQTLAEQLGL